MPSPKPHILALLALSLTISAWGQSAQQVRKFVNEQLSQYPKTHLIDLYKSCYQDFMGPEHLVPNREAARMYLQRELDGMGETVGPALRRSFEPCGIKGGHVRIDLECVQTGLVSADSLNSWFVGSANSARKHTLDDWIRYWTNIEQHIDAMNLNLPDYEKEKAFIQSMFSQGEYACSHSPEYRENYSPHYRIVSKRIFQKNKKFLSKGKKQETQK